jgi:CspA family cold shock protein
MADRVQGTVKWFSNDKGYGFITGPDGKDVFVHYSAIRGRGHRSLVDGQRVEYVVAPGTKGPQAQDVVPLE